MRKTEALWVSWSSEWEASNSVIVSVCVYVGMSMLSSCLCASVGVYTPTFHHGVCVMTPTWSGRSESEMKPHEENEKRSDYSVAESFITM